MWVTGNEWDGIYYNWLKIRKGEGIILHNMNDFLVAKEWRQTAVHQCLIKVQHKRILAFLYNFFSENRIYLGINFGQ
jgi:hypothetical protein